MIQRYMYCTCICMTSRGDEFEADGASGDQGFEAEKPFKDSGIMDEAPPTPMDASFYFFRPVSVSVKTSVFVFVS